MRTDTLTDFPLPKGHVYGRGRWVETIHDGYGIKDKPTEDQLNIMKIQRRLGVVSKDGGADGYFAEKTGRYVAEWQQKVGLAPTGQVDEKTWRAMGL